MTTNSSTSATGSTADALSADGAVSPALARVREAGLVLAGTVALILIGQITIPLPFTPVPISMGTFAALGVGAVLGSRRGALSALLLGALAAVGAPVLGGWTGGVGVTFGYGDMTLLSQDKATQPDWIIGSLPEIYENLRPKKAEDDE